MIDLPGPARSRLARLAAFWTYAAVLFVGTHWPRLTIPETGMDRPDLLVHAAIFGLWTLLLLATGYAGNPRARATAARAGLIGLLYAAFDEGTQAIPFIHRTAALDDFLANASGVLLATIAAAAWPWRAAAGIDPARPALSADRANTPAR